MAHLVTGYAGQAHIKSADEGAFNASFFGSEQYVMEYGNEFEGSIIDNNTVRIAEGEGLMYGRHFRVEAPEDLTITTGKAGTSRIDLICMTYEKDANDETEKVYLQVIKGTETTGTPTVPAYTDGNILEGASFNQMPLYKATIKGVVLSELKAVFETLPSYEGIARMYAERFETVCEELKLQFNLSNVLKTTDIVDNLTSDASNKALSAKQGKKLNEKCFGSPDYSTIIEEHKDTGFTASADGWLRIMAYSGWTSTVISINGNAVFDNQILNTDSYPTRSTVLVPVRKGDVIAIDNVSANITGVSYKVHFRLYGII